MGLNEKIELADTDICTHFIFQLKNLNDAISFKGV